MTTLKVDETFPLFLRNDGMVTEPFVGFFLKGFRCSTGISFKADEVSGAFGDLERSTNVEVIRVVLTTVARMTFGSATAKEREIDSSTTETAKDIYGVPIVAKPSLDQ